MWRSIVVCGAAVVAAAGVAVAADTSCQQTFPSTFAAIQKIVFENRGCSASICHAPTATGGPAGGLDLTADAAYDNLVNKPSQTVPGWFRVLQGERTKSLLFLNLAAKTLPADFKAPLRAMPLDPVPPISTNELEAIRKWIETGAPRDGTVAGTQDLLDACLPPPKPIEIDPLPPPPPAEGVQLHMPQWIVDAHSEHEVCYASYYDITDQVPEQYRGPNGTIRFKKTEIRQDPLSHHLIVNLYEGHHAITESVWGEFKCRGGALDGQACDPTDLEACGADSGCANDPAISIACFGARNLPDDAVTGIAASGFTGAQKTAVTITLAPGVYNEIPLKGVIIWNSHAFNVTDEDGKLEAWINLYFAAPEEQTYPQQAIFVADPPILFKTLVPPFKADEVCNVLTLPKRSQVFELSSHMHHRGKRWRTWKGSWTCQGGPNDGDPCSPFGPDDAFGTTDLCAGAPCQSKLPPQAGDCNADLTVSIDELIRGVNIVLGTSPVDDCPRFDMNDDKQVTIADLVAAVASAGQPALRDAQESLLYTNFIYNDPLVIDYDPPMAMGGKSSLAEERAVTYCALYDNGFSDPTDVKMKSTSPPPPLGIPLGGPCKEATGCTVGKVGEACSGTSEAAKNASCDSADGAGDGVCDACVLTGGVTTQDEMFLLLGSYFVKK
jgi:hypothetical protein